MLCIIALYYIDRCSSFVSFSHHLLLLYLYFSCIFFFSFLFFSLFIFQSISHLIFSSLFFSLLTLFPQTFACFLSFPISKISNTDPKQINNVYLQYVLRFKKKRKDLIILIFLHDCPLFLGLFYGFSHSVKATWATSQWWINSQLRNLVNTSNQLENKSNAAL